MGVNLAHRLREGARRLSCFTMTQEALEAALVRAERALARIERVAETAVRDRGRDEVLRAKVRAAIAQLDDLIQKADA